MLKKVLAVYRWAPFWTNSTVIVHTDNVTTKAAINKGACRNPIVMEHLRAIFWLATLFNFQIKCVFVSGVHNVEADALSRLHTWPFLLFWYSLISKGAPFSEDQFKKLSVNHMSHTTLAHILPQVIQQIPWSRT